MPSFVSKFLIAGNGNLLTAPATDGSSGQVLQTDGSGQLSFTSVTGLIDTTANYSWTGSHDFSQNVGIGTASPGAKLDVVGSVASTVGLIVQGAASQTAKLQEWQNSSSTVVGSMDNGGNFAAQSTVTTNYNVALVGMQTPDLYSSTGNLTITAGNNASSTGELIFETNNAGTATERVRVDETGNVGIGTTSPSSNLHVEGTTASGNVGVMRVVNNTTTVGQDAMRIMMPSAASGALNFSNNSGNFWRWFLGTAGEMRFDSADGTSKMYLTETGKLGLGAAPTTKLDIPLDNPSTAINTNNAIQAYNDNATTGNITALALSQISGGVAGAAVAGVHTGRTGGTRTSELGLYYYDQAISSVPIEAMRIDSTGNVGIGTTSPNGTLHVQTASTGATPNAAADDLVIENTGANTGITLLSGTSNFCNIYFGDSADVDRGRINYNHATDSMAFRTNAVDAITITSAQQVGIGTGDPTEKLHVLATNPNTTDCYIKVSGGGNANAGIRFEESDTGSQQSEISYEASSNKLHIKTGNGTQTERITVLRDTGLVGINNTSPSATLHAQVSGTDDIFKLERTDANGFLEIDFVSQYTNYNSQLDHVWKVNGTEVFRIDNNGDLQIPDTTDVAFTNVSGQGFLNFRGSINRLAIGGTATSLIEFNDDCDFQNYELRNIGEAEFTPTATPVQNVEGRVFMDSDDDRLKVYANGADRKLNTMSSVSIRPQQLVADATNPFTIVTRNQHVLAAFDDTTDEIGYYTGILPDDYQGDGVTVEISWIAATATSGNVRWLVAWERLNDGGTDLDSDSFAADNIATPQARATNGQIRETSIAFTDGGDMDSTAAGDVFRLRITRDADNASDTMVGDAQIVNVKIRGTNDA